MQVKFTLSVVLVDINSKVVNAWRKAFSDLPEVRIEKASILDQKTDAWVTPTNSAGSMDGGLDAVIKAHLGAGIEKKVQKQIRNQFDGHMPIGAAVCVPTGKESPPYLISVPTMESSAEDISDTMNVALACAAAFQMIHLQNARQPGSIKSVAMPGLGVGTGQVPVRVCANLMWTGYTLFNDHEFENFDEMQSAVRAQVEQVKQWDENTRVRIQVPPQE
jgi:O-acetyl-ADP-ribose deacetylase (regulator of RNase III)